jgi:hypothetical protein
MILDSHLLEEATSNENVHVSLALDEAFPLKHGMKFQFPTVSLLGVIADETLLPFL